MPTLVIHGDSDAIVPFEVSGKRSAEIIKDSEVVVVKDAPHGFNASHAKEFNAHCWRSWLADGIPGSGRVGG